MNAKNVLITTISALLLIQMGAALQDPHTVYGYVTYENLQEAVGATVTITTINETQTITTDARGRYYTTFENYQNGETLTVTATLPGYSGTATQVIDPAKGGCQVDITLIDITPPESVSNIQAESQPHWIKWSWNNPQDTDFAHTMIYINDTLVANTTNNYYNTTFNPHETAELSTKTVDTHGNINETSMTLTATVANSPIELTAPTTIAGAEGEPTTITLSTVDADNDTATYNTNRSDLFTIDQETGTATFTPTYAQSGTYYVEFSATDGYGSTSTKTTTLTIQDVPLTITGQWTDTDGNSTRIQAYTGASTQFNIQANRSTTNIKWYLDESLMQDGTSKQFTYKWPQAGTHTITATATDGIDTATATWNVTITDYTFTYNLEQGYNLISLPLETNYTAEEIAQLSGAKYIIVRTGTTYQTYIKDFSSQEDNFKVTPDMGYYLYTEQGTTFQITGKIPSRRSVQLTQGWNMVGWTSLNTATATTAFIDSMPGGTARYVIKRTPTGEYQTYIPGFSKAEDDFTVVPGNGYYVYLTADATLTYGQN